MPRAKIVPKRPARQQRRPVQPPEFPPFHATRPECLIIWRRRLRLTQAIAALRLEVPLDRLRRWEAGKYPGCVRSRVGRLDKNEICFLLRRRYGHTQAALAELVGVTRLWLVAMEAGESPVDRLHTFWCFYLKRNPVPAVKA